MHSQGQGCPICGKINRDNSKRTTQEGVLKKFFDIHGNRYDYSKVKYIDSKTPLIIICKIHGKFKQTSVDHMRTQGCKKCSTSKNEILIEEYLQKKSIHFEKQKTFKTLRNDNNTASLRYDFYLPSHNILIEYDGVQHFKPTNFGNSNMSKDDIIKTHNITKRNDEIKNIFSINNNIDLIRINYRQKTIRNLERELKSKGII